MTPDNIWLAGVADARLAAIARAHSAGDLFSGLSGPVQRVHELGLAFGRLTAFSIAHHILADRPERQAGELQMRPGKWQPDDCDR